MNTAIGMLLDQLGLANQIIEDVTSDRQRGFDVRTRRKVWATSPSEVRRYQPSKIKVRLDHGNDVLGQVVHLHRDRGNKLWAVAELHGDEVDPARLPTFYYSIETDSKRDHTDVVVTGVGLVQRTAQTCTTPVKILPGSVRDNRQNRSLSELEQEIISQAAETVRFRKDAQAPITVYDANDAELIGRSANNPIAWDLMDDQQDELQRALTGKLRYRPSTITRVY